MYCTGLVSKVIFFLLPDLCSNSDKIKYRCNAAWNNLDGEGGRRSHELTLALFNALDRVALWDDYGIVSDIMASQTCFYNLWLYTKCSVASHSLMGFLVQIFMSLYPRIFFIKLSRAPLKITLLLGLKIILILFTLLLRPIKY